MKPKVCSLKYLNSLPLNWGFLHSPLGEEIDMIFDIPSGTNEMIRNGKIDVAIISSIELIRQDLDYIKELGIACRGEVRSIFLISKKPFKEIRTLAADASSRTSVVLCQILLSQKFGVNPEMISVKPDLQKMLELADAALIIGDPALRLEPDRLPYLVLDLGKEWTDMTGLPMVFALWTARKNILTPALTDLFLDSYHYGRERIDEIVEAESEPRDFPKSLVKKYLTEHIVYEMDADCIKGLQLFHKYATDLRLV